MKAVETASVCPPHAKAHALGFVLGAIGGALEHADYDATMMPWPVEIHPVVLDEVRKIRGQLSARLAREVR